MYLQGAGGGIWYHDFEHSSHLPEYAQVQLRAGDLSVVPQPENAHELNQSLRPRDSAPKSRWAAYIDTLGEIVTADDQRTMSRQELIDWADELEAEAKESADRKGAKK